jgi:hypothetical protein
MGAAFLGTRLAFQLLIYTCIFLAMHTNHARSVVVTVAVTVSFSLTVSVTVMNTVSFSPLPPFGTGMIVNPFPPDPAPPVMIVDISGDGVGSGC